MSYNNAIPGSGITITNANGHQTISTTSGTFGTLQTYTPALSIGGSTTGITYVQQLGNYIVTGNMVSCSIYLVLTSKGVGTGSVTISLPFALNGSTVATPICPVVPTAMAALTGTVYGITTVSSTSLQLVINTGITSTNMTDTSLTNSTGFLISFDYYK